MEKAIQIRPVRLEDISAIERIRQSISEDTAEFDLKKFISRKITHENQDSFVVAEKDGCVAGFMISNMIYGAFGVQKSAWIVSMGVDPDFMGQGIGVKMAEAVFDLYRKKGVEYIYSSVIWDSIDLLSFFKKVGFERSKFINLQKKLLRCSGS